MVLFAIYLLQCVQLYGSDFDELPACVGYYKETIGKSWGGIDLYIDDVFCWDDISVCWQH